MDSEALFESDARSDARSSLTLRYRYGESLTSVTSLQDESGLLKKGVVNPDLVSFPITFSFQDEKISLRRQALFM